MSFKSLLHPISAAALAAALLAAPSYAASKFDEANRGVTEPSFASQMKCEDGTLSALYRNPEASSMPFGAIMANIFTFDEKRAEIARQRYGIGDRLQVLAVLKGSLAEQLGVKAGDVIMEINGNYVPRGTEALEQLKARVINKIDWSATVSATVIRDGFAIALRADMQPVGTAAVTSARPSGT